MIRCVVQRARHSHGHARTDAGQVIKGCREVVVRWLGSAFQVGAEPHELLLADCAVVIGVHLHVQVGGNGGRCDGVYALRLTNFGEAGVFRQRTRKLIER